MILKLAYANVKKSFKDYLVYFLTLMFSVCLFYTFNSFNSQQAMMELNNSQSTLLSMIGLFMNVLSFFVAIILGFLVLYANNFLIKRRKKEFGLYLIMGMPKKMVSKILICETFIVGLISLVCGLLLGIVVSQMFSLVTAYLLKATVNYQFIFSFSSVIITVISFALIFLVVMFFNTRIFHRVKVIDLLHASKKNEKEVVSRVSLSVLLFIISLVLLGIAYQLALNIQTFYIFFIPIIGLGILGTILFFLSLSGFFIKVVQSRKSVYFKGLNAFVLKQVNANLTTSFLTMSAVCLLLLLSIGAFSTGFNLSDAFSSIVDQNTPYDITLIERSEPIELKYEERVHIASLDKIARYEVELEPSAFYDELAKDDMYLSKTADVIALSDFNKLRALKGEEPVSLTLHHSLLVEGMMSDFLSSQKIDIAIGGQTFKNSEIYQNYALSTNYQSDFRYYIVVNDEELTSLNSSLIATYYNINTRSEESLAALSESITGRLGFVSTTEVNDQALSMSLLFTYIGLYLGFVFLMASAVILALQQLSQANENVSQYHCLAKLGAEKKMVNYALMKQIALYFGAPILLAMVHSIVGIQAVLGGFSILFGFDNLLSTGFITFIIFLIIYGFYYLITYFGCLRIISKSEY